MAAATPPDLGLGKVMAIAGGLLVVIRLSQAVRAWWGRRRRAQQRLKMDEKAASTPRKD